MHVGTFEREKEETLKGWKVGSAVVKGSNSGLAWPAGQALCRLRFPGRLLRAPGDVECSHRIEYKQVLAQ